MSSPIQFYRTFRSMLAEQGIRHVLTSGMACVEYGIQQTTKVTDWIIDPEDLTLLVTVFEQMESGLSGQNWRISYRPLFGAPLQKEYLAHGWTSHLAIHDSADSPEHHLDFFGQPPRITVSEALADSENGIASRLVVAQMKKTDRDKDWPSVEALSLQAAQLDLPGAVLHLRNPVSLANSRSAIAREQKAELLKNVPSSPNWTNRSTVLPGVLPLNVPFGSKQISSDTGPISANGRSFSAVGAKKMTSRGQVAAHLPSKIESLAKPLNVTNCRLIPLAALKVAPCLFRTPAQSSSPFLLPQMT